VAIKKRQGVIAADDVTHVFDDACMERLAVIGRLPETADRQRFADSVREAARIYARDARKPSEKTRRDEVESLHRAASRRDFKQVAELLGGLSPQTRRVLQAREATIGFKKAKLKMPSSKTLLRWDRRERACDVVRKFCSMGGNYIECISRSGKRSTKFKPTLYVPEPIKHPLKREPERQFVMHLQLAWLEAVGTKPTATVNPSRSDRPFANLVRECLRLAGASHADPVGLINDLNRRRRTLDERQ
jgi:hypothetical protein